MAAGAATFPGISKWSFACRHIANAIAQIKPAMYRPLFFTSPEYAMIERLIDIIIPDDSTPGAREAGVSEFIDWMISCHQPFRPNPRCSEPLRMRCQRFPELYRQDTTLSILAFTLHTSEYLVQQVRYGNL